MTEYSLLPDEFNFLFWQGDTLNIQFTVVDDNDQPVNLSLYESIRGQVRSETGTVAAELIIVESNLTSGIFETFLQQEDSAGLEPEVEYPFDIQLEGTKTIDLVEYKTINTVVHGFYQVYKEVTTEPALLARSYQQVQPGEKPSYTLHRRGL